MNNSSYILLMITMTFASSLTAEVYRWQDEKGKWHFTDRPQGNPKAEKMELEPLNGMTPVNIPKDLFSHLDKKKLKSKNGKIKTGSVVMYGTPNCGYCLRAKDYFNNHNIPYTEKDVSGPGRAQEEFVSLGGSGVPLILVGTRSGNKLVRGFSEPTLNELLGI